MPVCANTPHPSCFDIPTNHRLDNLLHASLLNYPPYIGAMVH